jgi:hypothetical protein
MIREKILKCVELINVNFFQILFGYKMKDFRNLSVKFLSKLYFFQKLAYFETESTNLSQKTQTKQKIRVVKCQFKRLNDDLSYCST